MGEFDGDSGGLVVGNELGDTVGEFDGEAVVGASVGARVLSQQARNVDPKPWSLVGQHCCGLSSPSFSQREWSEQSAMLVGAVVGEVVGEPVGNAEGEPVGLAVGRDDGESVGASDGDGVGAEVSHVFVSALHRPLTQSRAPFWHFWPGLHFGHSPPPQSVCVSRPFKTLSPHVVGVGGGNWYQTSISLTVQSS